MKMIRRLFYPLKESRSILIQASVSFFLIGIFLLFNGFINYIINNNCNYVSNNTMFERLEDEYDDITVVESVAKAHADNYSKLFKKDIDYKILVEKNFNTYIENRVDLNYFYYCSDVKEAFGYTSKAVFDVDKIDGSGVYISKYFSSRYNLNLGDYINIIYNDEIIGLKIVGIFNNENPNIQYRIYCDDEALYYLYNDHMSSEIIYYSNNEFDYKIIKSISSSYNANLNSRQVMVNYNKMPFDNSLKTLSVYLYVSVTIIGVCFFILVMIKEISNFDVDEINLIYYKNRSKLIIGELINNILLFVISFIISLILLFIVSLIIYFVKDAFIVVDVKFYLMSLFELLFVLLATLISYFIKIKKLNKNLKS